ncbi:MAG: 2Fe-2S iron-sulfur cluster-binding protein [Microcystaceae cyanobacterium]
MVTYNVTLINHPQNFRKTIAIPDTESILDEASEQGITIPFECVVGSCATCQGMLISGTVDQSEQIFLSEQDIEKGAVLTCVAKPTSDCVIEIELDHYL